MTNITQNGFGCEIAIDGCFHRWFFSPKVTLVSVILFARCHLVHAVLCALHAVQKTVGGSPTKPARTALHALRAGGQRAQLTAPQPPPDPERGSGCHCPFLFPSPLPSLHERPRSSSAHPSLLLTFGLRAVCSKEVCIFTLVFFKIPISSDKSQQKKNPDKFQIPDSRFFLLSILITFLGLWRYGFNKSRYTPTTPKNF